MIESEQGFGRIRASSRGASDASRLPGHASFGIVQNFVVNAKSLSDMAGLRAAIETSCRELGFHWSRLQEHVELGEQEWRYMARAADHGLAEGFTVPNHIPGEAFGSCHFAVRKASDLPSNNLPAAQALGSFAFEKARQLLEAHAQSSEEYVLPAPLTERQRDCLLFAARGKSDSVIAELLDIRPKTVNEHIEAAKRRYSVATRTQLIVRALFRSEICFAEVLD